MALSDRSIFFYGIQVTENNRSVDFKAEVTDTSPRLASLRLGFYTPEGLGRELERALSELDTLNTYTASIDRTILSGTETRLTIASNNSFFEILFLSGPRGASNASGLLGLNFIDYTGATTYTGSFAVGTTLQPTRIGYSYLSPEYNRKVFGNVNVSASGLKEAIVFNIQKFTHVEFKYEPKALIESDWVPFMDWAIQQRPFTFTPEISSPLTFYEVTLEKTSEDGKGLGYRLDEMLPQFPNFYKTGILTMRQENI